MLDVTTLCNDVAREYVERLQRDPPHVTREGARSCPHCWHLLEYVYHIWWRCRECGTWSA